LLKDLCINPIVESIEGQSVALVVDAIIVGEVVGINGSIIMVCHLPNILINRAKILFYLSFPMIKRCDTIKEWRLAPDMVEHNLSHLTPRLLSLENGDHGSDTT
jgi:hypothetical protein